MGIATFRRYLEGRKKVAVAPPDPFLGVDLRELCIQQRGQISNLQSELDATRGELANARAEIEALTAPPLKGKKR